MAEKKTSWTRHLTTFLIIFALGGFIMYRTRGCQPPGRREGVRPQDARVVELKIDRWYVQAEVADTPELRRKGLMNRTTLESGYGMLFVYEEPSYVRFWMKNTSIPLSIAFMGEDGTILQIEKMQPEDLRLVPSRDPVRYALEVRQGWFEDHAVKPGVKVELPHNIPPPPRQPAPEVDE